MMHWELLHPKATVEQLGLLPDFLHESDPLPAAKQFDKNYRYGGWRPTKGFWMHADLCLQYPGDPPVVPLAKTMLRDETIIIYRHSWVAVIQPDGSFEVCRMD